MDERENGHGQLNQRALKMLLDDAECGLRDAIAGRVLSEEEFRKRLSQRPRRARVARRWAVGGAALGILGVLFAIWWRQTRNREDT